jgi:hypothetical protein
MLSLQPLRWQRNPFPFLMCRLFSKQERSSIETFTVLTVPRQCVDERMEEIIAAFRLAFKYIDSLMVMNMDVCKHGLSPDCPLPE